MKALIRSKESVVLLIFIGVFVVFAATTERFARPENLLNIARQYSELAVVAVGLTMIIITGGIDISVGSIVGLSSIVLGVLVGKGMDIWTACAAALVVGLLCGLLNGLVITKLGVQPIVATLAMMSAARGLAWVLSGARSLAGFPDSFIELGQTEIGPVPFVGFVPVSVCVALVFAVSGLLLLRFTSLGRTIHAVGFTEEAARLSGIGVVKVKVFAYSLTGILCGLGGIMMTSRVASSVPDAGNGFEFEAITAVVMGGSSLRGGEGSIIGTMIGVAVMGILRNGLNLRGVPNTWQVLFLGAMLILAVLADNLRIWMRKRLENRQTTLKPSKAEV